MAGRHYLIFKSKMHSKTKTVRRHNEDYWHLGIVAVTYTHATYIYE
jgi:hypothetical protein